MIHEYKVMGDGKQVGTARLTKEGLYYRIRCICQLPQREIYRLMVNTDSGQTDLGICVPVGEGFGLETSVSARKIGEGEPQFWIHYGRSVPALQYLPLSAERPFERIDMLKKGRLVKDEGTFRLAVTKQN